MRRRALLAAGGASFATTAIAQTATPGPVVAVLSPIAPEGFAANLAAFREGLRKAGGVDGRAVRVELRFAGGAPERLPGLAAELVKLRPGVIVAGSTAGAVAAARATSDIPIVFIGVSDDPVALGLVASLARPGRNVTGFTLADDLGLVGKRLELLKEALPRARRIGALVNPDDSADASLIRFLRMAADGAGLEVEMIEVRRPDDLDAAVDGARGRIDALFVALSPMFNTHRVKVAALAARARLPAMYGFSEFIAAGGLMSYGPSLADLYGIAADYVVRILRGEAPGALPVQQPTSFRFSINLGAARGLGLEFPQSILQRADEVID